MSVPDRRTRLLEEALRLVSEAGLGAVTHRSVETAAQAPHGSVTYWFGSREGLINAMVDTLCAESERQAGAITAPVQDQMSSGQPPDVAAVAAAIAAWIDGAASHHLARLELELEGAREPAVAARMIQASEVFWQMGGSLATALGSVTPDADGHAIVALIDGLMMDRLAHPGQGHDVLAAAVRWLLTGPPYQRAPAPE
jgi:AcrR family transcriptional regulator